MRIDDIERQMSNGLMTYDDIDSEITSRIENIQCIETYNGWDKPDDWYSDTDICEIEQLDRELHDLYEIRDTMRCERTAERLII